MDRTPVVIEGLVNDLGDVSLFPEDTSVYVESLTTTDPTLEVFGTAEPNAELQITFTTRQDGSRSEVYAQADIMADGSGNWRYTFTEPSSAIEGYNHLINVAHDADDSGSIDAIFDSFDSKYVEIVPGQQTAPDLPDDTTYDIAVDLNDQSLNILSQADKDLLTSRLDNAAKVWEDIIQYDVPDVVDYSRGNIDVPSGDPEYGNIDDLKVVVKFNYDPQRAADATTGSYQLRSPGKYQGQTDPLTGAPMSNYELLPYYAELTINTAKLTVDELLYSRDGFNTLVHELGHGVGFSSTVFNEKGLYTQNPVYVDQFGVVGRWVYGFTGENALDVYHSTGGNQTYSAVPLEPVVNTQTQRPGHWNEWLFPDGRGEWYDRPYMFTGQGSVNNGYPDEAMTTSFVEGANRPNTISTLTVAALRDIGYSGAIGGVEIPIHQGTTIDETTFNAIATTVGGLQRFYENPLNDIGL